MKKSLIQKRIPVLFLLIIFSISSSGCSTIRKHPDFEKLAPRVKKVTVIEPDVEIVRLVFKGDNETLYKESAQAEKWALTSLETEFAKKGYEVKPFELTEEMQQKYPDWEKDLGKLKQKYVAQIGDIKKKKKSNFRLSLGSEINQLADLMDVDAFIFAVGSGFVKSEGEIARDVAKTVLIAAASLGHVIIIYNKAGGIMNISVIESDTGDMLWNNVSNAGTAYDMTKHKAVRSVGKDVLKKYPPRKGFVAKPTGGKSDDEDSGGKRKSISVPLETLKLAGRLVKAVGQTAKTVTEESVQVTVQAGKIAPMAVISLVSLGTYRTNKGDLKGAIQAYEEAVKADKTNAGLHLILGEAYFRDGNLRKAEKSLRKSVELDAAIPQTHKILSEVLYKKQKMEEGDKESQLYEQLLLKTAPPAAPLTAQTQP